MHFICDIPKKEGTYHVRIYDVYALTRPNREKPTLDGHASFAGLFDRNTGKDLGIPISGDLVFEDGFGDFQYSRGNELEQSGFEHQNFKLSIESDPAIEEIVASIRDIAPVFSRIKEIWLEITFESKAENIPDLIPLQFVQPRKIRSVFWGKLVRNEASGYSDYQKYKGGLVRDPKVRMHVGGLEFTFVHWLHVRMSHSIILSSDDCSLWLYQFITSKYPPVAHADTFIPLAALFYEILNQLSPTSLVSTADRFLAEVYDYFPGGPGSTDPIHGDTAGCAVWLPVPLAGTTGVAKFLNEVFWKVAANTSGVVSDSDYTALFEHSGILTSKPDFGKYSLFSKWKTFGDAFTSLCREFFYTIDVEIPTMAEAVEVYLKGNVSDNTRANRQAHWAGATRWLFVALGDDIDLTITPRPQEQSVKYTPCGVWLSHLKVTEPIDDTTDIEVICEFTNDIPEGLDISFETLSRFCARKAVAFGGGDDERGYELWVDNLAHSSKEFARTASYSPKALTYDWADAHCKRRTAIWSGARSIIEFDHEGVGLATYDDPNIRPFGFLDWGDFGMMRYFHASPGLLFKGGQFGKYDILEISRHPGGNTHIKAIEQVVLGTIDTSTTIDSPDPPRIDTPPVFSGSPVCGTITVTFCVLYKAGCVDHADITVNGQFFGTVNNFPDPMPEDCVPVTVVINTANLPNGGNVVCITLTLCDGTIIGPTCWNFNVQNPCSMANTTQKAF